MLFSLNHDRIPTMENNNGIEINKGDNTCWESKIIPSEYNIFNTQPGDIETVNLANKVSDLPFEQLIEATKQNQTGEKRILVDLDKTTHAMIPAGMSEKEVIELYKLIETGVFTFHQANADEANKEFSPKYNECLDILSATSERASEQGYGLPVQLSQYGYVFVPPNLTEEQVKFLNHILFSGVEIYKE